PDAPRLPPLTCLRRLGQDLEPPGLRRPPQLGGRRGEPRGDSSRVMTGPVCSRRETLPIPASWQPKSRQRSGWAMWPICYAQELNGASKFAGASVTGPYASLTCWNADHHCKTRLVAGVVAGQALEVRGVLHNLLIRAG